MRSAPSFIGDFQKQKRKPSTSRSAASELPIEKEADLREKRKQQILKRLKHKAGHEDHIEIGVAAQKNLPNDEISEKVIFSPRTAKRFQEVSQKRVEGEDVRSPSYSQTEMPMIVVQETPGNSTKIVPETLPATHSHRKEVSEPAIQRNKATYVPSFADKSKPVVRSAQNSPIMLRREKTYTHVARKTSSNLEEERSKERRIAASLPASYHNSPNYRRKNALPAQKPPLITSSSVEVTDESEPDSSPLRRSASFHSLKDRERMKGRQERQFLTADDDFRKNWSLPSIKQQSSSLTSLVDYDNISSTKSLKLQQDKLEEEFHRLEEDLDRAFSELRNLLKTS